MSYLIFDDVDESEYIDSNCNNNKDLINLRVCMGCMISFILITLHI